MASQLTYSRLKKASVSERAEMHGLLKDLSASAAKQYSPTTLARALGDANTYILAVRDKKIIVGTGTLIVMATASGLRGRIEDVVVSSAHRGQGIGRAITEQLIAEARRRHLMQVELTSAPSRKAANHLYASLGFEPRDTNVYRMKL